MNLILHEYFSTPASDPDGEMVPSSQDSAGHTGELEAGGTNFLEEHSVFLGFSNDLHYLRRCLASR
jgi:hypothetical protein